MAEEGCEFELDADRKRNYFEADDSAGGILDDHTADEIFNRDIFRPPVKRTKNQCCAHRDTGWSNLARGKFLALRLDWKAIFQASFVSFHTDALTKDTLCGSIVTEPVSWLWFDDSYFLFRAQPCIKHKRVSHHADNKLQCSVIFS